MEWFNLALISAVSLALADTFFKKYFSLSTGWELLLVRFSAPGVLLLPLAFAGDYPPITSEFWLWIAALIPMELVAMLCYSLAIRDSALYLTLPYLAFTPVFSVATGYFILGEEVSPDKFFGIILVVFGAYLLNSKKHLINRPRDLLLPLLSVVSERGSRLMLAAAVIYSFTSVMGKGAMQYIEPRHFGAFYFSMVGAGALLVTVLIKPKSIAVVRDKPLSVLLVAVFMCVMVISHFLAVAQVEVAYMITVKRTSLLFGIVFGAIFFSEKGFAQNLIAGSMMVAGVAVILI
ncbi:MAG: DMT family transporter [Gammaproteobacteria bacterium]|jgi:drug/metabolite transporter (DMT)-like permease